MRPSELGYVPPDSDSESEEEKPEEKEETKQNPSTQLSYITRQSIAALTPNADRSPSIFTPSSSDDEAEAAAATKRKQRQKRGSNDSRRTSNEDGKKGKVKSSKIHSRSAVRIAEVPEVKNITPRVSRDWGSADFGIEPTPAPPAPRRSPSKKKSQTPPATHRKGPASAREGPLAAATAVGAATTPPADRKGGSKDAAKKASQDAYPAVLAEAPVGSAAERKGSGKDTTKKTSQDTHPATAATGVGGVTEPPGGSAERKSSRRSSKDAAKRASQTQTGDKPARKQSRRKALEKVDQSKAAASESGSQQDEESMTPPERKRENSWFGYPREEKELPAAITTAMVDSDDGQSSAGDLSISSKKTVQSQPSTPRAFHGDQPSVAAARARASWQASREEAKRFSQQQAENATPQTPTMDSQTKIPDSPSRTKASQKQQPVAKHAAAAGLATQGPHPGTSGASTPVPTPSTETQQRPAGTAATGGATQASSTPTPFTAPHQKPSGTVTPVKKPSVNVVSRRASVAPQGSDVARPGTMASGRSQPPAKTPLGAQAMEAAAKVSESMAQTLADADNQGSGGQKKSGLESFGGGGNVKGAGSSQGHPSDPSKVSGDRVSPGGGCL